MRNMRFLHKFINFDPKSVQSAHIYLTELESQRLNSFNSFDWKIAFELKKIAEFLQ